MGLTPLSLNGSDQFPPAVTTLERNTSISYKHLSTWLMVCAYQTCIYAELELDLTERGFESRTGPFSSNFEQVANGNLLCSGQLSLLPQRGGGE